MSDAFFAMVSDGLTPSRDLARGLLLSRTEADDILNEDYKMTDGVKILKVKLTADQIVT